MAMRGRSNLRVVMDMTMIVMVRQMRGLRQHTIKIWMETCMVRIRLRWSLFTTDNYVSIAGDCNDSSAAAHNGATETCDNIDNDCDGDVDEQNATGCLTYYQDIDNDGYGTASSICACQPEGDYTTTTSGDCFDDGTNASITYPEHLIQRLPLHVETMERLILIATEIPGSQKKTSMNARSLKPACPLVGMVRFLPVAKLEI